MGRTFVDGYQRCFNVPTMNTNHLRLDRFFRYHPGDKNHETIPPTDTFTTIGESLDPDS
jgi:hypothetical protein